MAVILGGIRGRHSSHIEPQATSQLVNADKNYVENK